MVLHPGRFGGESTFLCQNLTLATLAIFSFMQTWNDFIRPLIFLNSNKKMTLTLGLYNMMGNYATNWGLMMAAVIFKHFTSIYFLS